MLKKSFFAHILSVLLIGIVSGCTQSSSNDEEGEGSGEKSVKIGYFPNPSVEELVTTGFLDQLQLRYRPEQEKYGAYLVHYSGWEDAWGMLTDSQLKERFDEAYPSLANVVRPAERGQQWHFQ